MAGSNSTRGGVSLFGLLGVAFIVLRLVGVIDWPWWAVLAPLWAPIAAAVVILAALVIWKG